MACPTDKGPCRIVWCEPSWPSLCKLVGGPRPRLRGPRGWGAEQEEPARHHDKKLPPFPLLCKRKDALSCNRDSVEVGNLFSDLLDWNFLGHAGEVAQDVRKVLVLLGYDRLQVNTLPVGFHWFRLERIHRN